MIKFIQNIGKKTLAFIRILGANVLFLLKIFALLPQVVLRPRLMVRQMYFSGVLSVLIIAVSGLFVGMVLGLQGYTQLAKFKSADVLGFMVAAALLRELGPVLAAILFASSAGGAMTSEIGLMKTTEQLEAMNVMAINPVARVVAPRFWAGVLSMPLLASIFNVSGIWGGYLVGVEWLGLDAGVFWSHMQKSMTFQYDVLNGLIKSFIFGMAVSLIAVYQGFHCRPTAEGILRASTRTVVSSALTVLALDFILTAFMFTE
ncbi:lipid asymmetry maintenance ABC transporter permease subunit MlaE [Alysiella crassa]|uniref:Intermembrane phospholipid transport system permease protein MlaE n=1 Tax=Alysiella crassa TaxID=153491 RepID=A0A376BRK8_9NEIS|nr:Probable phospholipid ABC transporter permease protein mlaE [Alysiella crassa]